MFHQSIVRRGVIALVVSAIGAGCVAGCGGNGLDASSSCKDFLSAPQQDQDEAVSRVASDLRAANAVTPLGRPNINYLCANHPDMTLGDAVKATG